MQQTLLIAVFAAVLAAAPCAAQRLDPPPPAVGNDRDVGVNQLSKFGSYDAIKTRLKQWNKKGKTIGELLAEDKASAAALVASSKFQCIVIDAILVAVDDNSKTKTYEVACQSGIGYFLVEGGQPEASSGFSCFAAEAARAVDLAAKRELALACGLPENPSAKAMAASILAHAGKVCTVGDFKWRGQSATTDFLELTCAQGPGYMVRSPLPGSHAPLHVDTCSDSAAAGLACRLPGNDTTLAHFKDALALRRVSCDADAIHVIGREAVRQRQVVEYFCPKQQPKGLVVYLPAEGSTEPFEALDCIAAAKRQAICTLTKPN